MKSDQVRSVSVVTVCLNAADAIEISMQSVRDQSFCAVEHLVVDGGSTDDTLKIVQRFPSAKIFSEPDDGIYYAMQKGAKLATGDAVYFLNAGDQFDNSEVLEKVVEYFNLTGADAVFGNLLPIDRGGAKNQNHPAFCDGQALDFSYFNNRRLFFNECVHHQTTFYRRKIFEKCSFICDDSRANGEYYLNCCAFVQNSFAMKHLPLVVCRFALGGHSTHDYSLEWKRFKVARDILRARFFPKGRKVPLPAGRDEYLHQPLRFSQLTKIRLRSTSLFSVYAYLRELFRYWKS